MSAGWQDPACRHRRGGIDRGNTVLFKMVRPSRVTALVDVDEIGHLSLVTPLVDEEKIQTFSG